MRAADRRLPLSLLIPTCSANLTHFLRPPISLNLTVAESVGIISTVSVPSSMSAAVADDVIHTVSLTTHIASAGVAGTLTVRIRTSTQCENKHQSWQQLQRANEPCSLRGSGTARPKFAHGTYAWRSLSSVAFRTA